MFKKLSLQHCCKILLCSGTRTSSFASRARSPESEKKLMSSDPTSVLKQDYREFSCVYWKLEPTVR